YRGRKRSRIVLFLLEKVVDQRQRGDGPVQKRIRTLLISADADKIFRRGISSEKLANTPRFLHMFGRRDRRHQPAKTIKHGDGRIMAARIQTALEHNMPIEKG